MWCVCVVCACGYICVFVWIYVCVGEIYIERESRNQRKIEDEKKEEYEKCLYLRIYVIYQSIDLSMYLCIYMCMHVCMHICMYGCTYACIHSPLFPSLSFSLQSAPNLNNRRRRSAACDSD